MSAQDFAARILAAIDRLIVAGAGDDYCRERVASDLRAIERAEEGLRDCYHYRYPGWIAHSHRYTDARDDAWASLKRTGSLYGVTDASRDA